MSLHRDREQVVLQFVLEHMLAVQEILTDRVGPVGRRVFVCLAVYPEISVGEIAKCVRVSDSIASRAVSQLVQMNLARVVIDPASRRRHLVQLTRDGVLYASRIAQDSLRRLEIARKKL